MNTDCDITEIQCQDTCETPCRNLLRVWKKCKEENNGKLAEELLPANKEEGEYGTLFRLFATNLCAPNVVGQTVWRKRKAHELYSDIVTMADESFAFLVLENNFDAWMRQVRNVENVLVNGTNDDEVVGTVTQEGEDTDESTDVSGLTAGTQETIDKTGAEELVKETRYTKCRGNGVGWSEEGLKRFGEIMKLVITSRKNSNINGRMAWEENEKEKFLHLGRTVPIGNGVGAINIDREEGINEHSEKETASSALLVAYEFEKNGT